MQDTTADRRRFEILLCLGAGGFGEVYLANMVSPGGVRAEVALKVLHQGLDPRSQAIQRLKDEARLLGLLNHPSILRIHDLVLLEDRVTLVTEYVAGGDLDTCLSDPDPVPIGGVLEVIGKVADALQDAWTRAGPDGPLRLLHRDIKPSNIRIGRHGEVKLLDFGIAKAAGMDREAKTQTDTVLGSFPYMAPERFDSAGDVPAGDVFSLGCTLYEAVAGERLFDLEVRKLYGLAMFESRHRGFVTERLDALSGVPAPVRELLAELLAFDPAGRPPLDGLGIRCEDLAAEIGGIGLGRWCRRHAWSEPQDVAGALSGRTITESSVSSAHSLTFSFGPDESTDATDSATEPERFPAAGPEAAAGPARPPATAPAVRPERASPAPSQRRALLALGGAGIVGLGLMAGVVLVAVLAVVAVGVAEGPGTAGERAPTVAQAEADPAVARAAVHVEDRSEAGAEGRVDVRPVPAPARAAGEAVRSEPEAPVAAAETATSGAGIATCGDPFALEPPAALGRLDAEQRRCLSAAMRDDRLALVDRGKLGRIRLVDAKARCDAGDCTDYAREQPWFFEEIDRSDADMLFAWVSYLDGSAGSEPSRLAEVRTWVGRTMERKHTWRGQTYVKRVDRLLEIDARAAYALWQAEIADEKRRVKAKNAAIEWMNNRVQLGRDATVALELCASAAGNEAACQERMHDEKAVATVTFVSIPIGASVLVDGVQVGEAPVTVELAFGAHTVDMTVGGKRGRQQITVGSEQPSRWIWQSGSDAWRSTY